MTPELDAEAVPAEATDDTATSSVATDAEAASSPADAKEAPASLLDVVRNVVEPEAPEAAAAPSATEAEKTEPEEAPAAVKADAPENLEALPFHRHPDFQKVVKDRKALRDQVSTLEAQTAELKGPAEQYRAITNFAVQNELSDKDVVDILVFRALAKSQPDKALEAISPLLNDLYTRTGRILPDDIRQDVEDGKITEERGRELAKTRATAAESDRRATRATERATEVERSTEAQKTSQAIEAALEAWEAQKKTTDPDFDAKQELIADRCRTLIATRGQPQNPDDARSLVEQAHKDVTAHLRKVLPARPEVRRPSRNSSSPQATAQPKTLQEAVSLAAAAGG